MKKINLFILYILTIFCISSCISNVVDSYDDNASETQTKIAQSVEETVAVLHTTVIPTVYIRPQNTPSPIPSPSSFLTPNPYNQEIASPNGLFIAKLYSFYENSSWVEAVELWNTDGDLLINIPYQGEITQGDPRDYMRIAGWSSDSTKLFFYYSWAYDGWYTLFDGSNLQYIDVTTGEINEFVPGIVAFDFSPDNSKIAYLSCCEVVIRDLVTEEESIGDILMIEHSQAGWVHISPSGEKVVYHLLVDDYNGTAILFDTAELQQILLVENHWIETIFFEGWDENDNPIIGFDGCVNVYNPESRSMRPIATYTPYPE